MRIRAVLLGIALCIGASSAHAQLPPGPMLVDGGVCLPSDNPFDPCVIRVMTPNNSDLQCVFFTNVKLVQVIDLPMDPVLNPTGVDCIGAAPNTTILVRMNRPNPLGTGHVLYVSAGQLTVGITRASPQTGILVDISLSRFKRLAVCPLQAIVGPIVGCPATGNDISPGEPIL